MTEAGPTAFDYLKLAVENLSLWPLIVLGLLIWLARRRDLLDRLTGFSFGGLEVKLNEIRAEVAQSKEQISALENELALERAALQELIAGFNPHAPVAELEQVRDKLKANARAMSDLSAVKDFLRPEATAAELYAAAETLRERRPTAFAGDLVACLERLAGDDDLRGVRLHTVWSLVSALHRILIADIRDGAQPRIPAETLAAAEAMLDRLEANPRVRDDRPDAPDAGVRGPLRHARSWIVRARRG